MERGLIAQSFLAASLRTQAVDAWGWALQKRLREIAAEDGLPDTARQVNFSQLYCSHYCDYDRECQKELLLLANHSGKSCVFGDILGFVKSEHRGLIVGLQRNPNMAIEVLAPLMTDIIPQAKCLVHTLKSKCSLKCARRHFAGGTCHPFPRRGVGFGLADP